MLESIINVLSWLIPQIRRNFLNTAGVLVHRCLCFNCLWLWCLRSPLAFSRLCLNDCLLITSSSLPGLKASFVSVPNFFFKLFLVLLGFTSLGFVNNIYKEKTKQFHFSMRWPSSHSVWKWKSLSCVQLFATPWNSPGQNTRVGTLSLLQRNFPTQGLNPGLTHWGRILNQLSHKGSPRILEWVAYPFSRGSSWPRNQTGVSCVAGWFFTNWTIRKAPNHNGKEYEK